MSIRILQGGIKEYKRIIVIPRDEDSIGRECCIKKQKTTVELIYAYTLYLIFLRHMTR